MTEINSSTQIQESWQQMLLGRESYDLSDSDITHRYQPVEQSGYNYYCHFELGPSARYITSNTYGILIFPFEYFLPEYIPTFRERNVSPLIGNLSQRSEQGTTEQQEEIKERLDALKDLAGITNSIYYQTTSGKTLSSSGGFFSLTSPMITIPSYQLRRPITIATEDGERDEIIPYGCEKPEHRISEDPFHFTDHEMSFLILREMGKIKQKRQFLRTVSKVMAVALFIALGLASLSFLSPLVLVTALPFFAKFGIWALYILFHNLVISRYLEENADDFAVRKLSEYLEKKKLEDGSFQVAHNPYTDSPIDAARFVAIKTLEKIRWHNRLLRKENCVNQACIDSDGSDRRDISVPSLISRIDRIRSQNYRL